MHYANENTTDYLARFRNSQNINEVCNGSLITRSVQENGMNILLLLKNTGLYSLQEYEKKEADKAEDEMLCAILYIENSDKARFADL